jgi:hypothetical protein
LNSINQERVDLILQYILVVASRHSGWDRELGMIHLIKYAYLADLVHAEVNQGKTYTGLPWRFHHFGPWSVELFHSIEPALLAIGATKRLIQNPKDDKDFARWSINDDRLFDDIGDKLDLSVMGAIQSNVRRFGNDTPALLDYVYKTRPMLTAAPEELLDFSLPEIALEESEKTITKKPTPTARELKKRRDKLKALKQRINAKLNRELAERRAEPAPPRYDEIFLQGLNWLNSSEGKPIQQGDYTAEISDDMWKSKARFDPNVS